MAKSVEACSIDAARNRLSAIVSRVATGVDVGYALSSEEHRPLDLVRMRAGGGGGFPFALVSTTSTRGSTARVRARSCGR